MELVDRSESQQQLLLLQSAAGPSACKPVEENPVFSGDAAVVCVHFLLTQRKLYINTFTLINRLIDFNS